MMIEPVDKAGLVSGIFGLVIGVVLLIVGLSADLSRSLIRALGGQCLTLFGNLAVQGALSIVPTILLGIGVLFILVGSITAYRAAHGWE